MKITTLIPAYKPQYLQELLLALRHQSLKPERIIISDDSPGQHFLLALAQPHMRSWVEEMNIQVVRGPQAGGWANFRHLLKCWAGATELMHFLLDDDIIYPDFYERHLRVHELGVFDCTISRRWTALESGQPVGSLPAPASLLLHPQKAVSVDASIAFSTVLPGCNNWFGEFSNAVMNRSLYDVIDHQDLGGVHPFGLEDVGTFLNASRLKPICYINEALGFFRINPGQHSQQVLGRQMKQAYLAWYALGIGSLRCERISSEQALACFAHVSSLIRHHYAEVPDMAEFLHLGDQLAQGAAGASEKFLAAWDAFTAMR